MKVSPCDEVNVLIRRREPALSLCALMCRDTPRRQSSINQEEGPHQEHNHAGTLIDLEFYIQLHYNSRIKVNVFKNIFRQNREDLLLSKLCQKIF